MVDTAGEDPVVIVADEDRAAGFDALYAAEYAAMVRLAYLVLGSAELAEEAVQDGFAVVLERWDRLDNPGGYLRTCVLNRCRDRQRRARLERDRAAAAASDRREPATSSPQSPHDLGTEELAEAVAALSVRHRAVLVLRFYEGLSEAETAATLGIRPGTVKSRTSRALSELRKVIEP